VVNVQSPAGESVGKTAGVNVAAFEQIIHRLAATKAVMGAVIGNVWLPPPADQAESVLPRRLPQYGRDQFVPKLAGSAGVRAVDLHQVCTANNAYVQPDQQLSRPNHRWLYLDQFHHFR